MPRIARRRVASVCGRVQGGRAPQTADVAGIRDAASMAEITGNRAIEAAAMARVIDLELRTGPQPVDTRFAGAPADILSPPQVIEVKAFGKSNRGYDLWLQTRQLQEALKNPDFYLYVVENVRQGDPALFTLRVLGGEPL